MFDGSKPAVRGAFRADETIEIGMIVSRKWKI
jgi:hypothetical protein